MLSKIATAGQNGQFRTPRHIIQLMVEMMALDPQDEICDYLAHNGTITVDVLYRSPFNSIAPGGPEDLFIEVDIDAMITTIHSVNATAIPA